jgi:hypothetical protein
MRLSLPHVTRDSPHFESESPSNVAENCSYCETQRVGEFHDRTQVIFGKGVIAKYASHTPPNRGPDGRPLDSAAFPGPARRSKGQRGDAQQPQIQIVPLDGVPTTMARMV